MQAQQAPVYIDMAQSVQHPQRQPQVQTVY
jgi:hypothetical protein